MHAAFAHPCALVAGVLVVDRCERKEGADEREATSLSAS